MPVGIGAPENIGVLGGIGLLDNIGVLEDTGVLEQRVAAGGSPLRGDHSLKEAPDCFPHRRCEGVP